MEHVKNHTLQRAVINVTHDISEINLNEAEAAFFSISVFQARGRRYVLRQATECQRTFEDGYHVIECPEYDVSGYSQDKEEALTDLNADFACLYEGLVSEPDSVLTLDAREVRDRLRAAVLRVESEPAPAEPVSTLA